MQFHSGAFLLLAALTVLLYFSVPKRMQWWVLLGASYVFYAFVGLSCFALLLFTTGVTFVTSRLMGKEIEKEDRYVEENRAALEKAARKAYREAGRKQRFWILLAGLFLGLGALAVLKYTGFVLSSVKSIFGGNFKIPSLLLPLGISFYTFQSMGYLIDVYRKKVTPEKNFFKLSLFVCYFPQLVQGPISRFSDLAEQLYAEHKFEKNAFWLGLLRVLWGYFKKLAVADTAMIGVRFLVENSTEFDGVYVLLLILLYSAEIYGDFTGGIDVTVGLSEMMGIRLQENFNRPFSSRSVKEYWNRWHITMGSWFTDYVFYPLSVSAPMQKFSVRARKRLGDAVGKRIPVYIATVVTWFLTGLWHGAGWNFIVWGLLNCFAILISQELNPLWLRFGKKFPKLSASRGFDGFRAVRTFLLMGLFRSLDCYRDVPLTFRLWGSMFTHPNFGELFSGGLTSFGLSLQQIVWILFGCLVIFAVTKRNRDGELRKEILASPTRLCVAICTLLFVILVFGAYGIGYDASDFIYGQF